MRHATFIQIGNEDWVPSEDEVTELQEKIHQFVSDLIKARTIPGSAVAFHVEAPHRSLEELGRLASHIENL